MAEKRWIKSFGFTLIELILVIAIIAILSVSVMPRFTVYFTNINYAADKVLNDIRFAQAMSLASGQRYRFTRTSPNTYQITNQTGTPITLPGGGTLGSGITFGSWSNLPNGTIAFSPLGVPYIDTTIPGTALSGNGSIVILGPNVSRTILIYPRTGYGTLT